MGEVIVDTNFILNCIRFKVDMYEEFLLRGESVIIPEEVIWELKRLSEHSRSLKLREEARLALKLIDSGEHRVVSIGGKYVDVGLRKYLGEHPRVILATMDKELKKSVSNRKYVIRNRKKLELQ